MAYLEIAARSLGDQDRRSRRRQGRAGGAEPGRGPPDVLAKLSGRRVRRRRAHRRHRGGAGGRGVLAARPLRRHATPCRCCRRRTSSASATATPAPTPAAWAPTRRCRTWTAQAVDGIMDTAVLPAGRGAAPPRHRLPRRALRRPHADGGRPQGHRVQRALRGPRGPGGAAAAGRRRRRALPRRGQRGPRAERTRPAFSGDAAVCVVLASQGYPESPRTGDAIEGLDASGQSVAAVDGVTVFHAGTRRHGHDGPFYTAGGRVLGVTAVAPTLGQARERAYAAAEPIDWEGMQMRHDIAAAGGRLRRSGRERAPDDPALRAGGHGGAVQRHGALRALARGRAAGHRGPGRRRASCRPRTPPPAGPRPPRSTTSSWPTCSSARRSRTTTWPPSSTWCRSASARRPARTSTTG